MVDVSSVVPEFKTEIFNRDLVRKHTGKKKVKVENGTESPEVPGNESNDITANDSNGVTDQNNHNDSTAQDYDYSTVLRVDIKTEEDANKWMDLFQRRTKTQWIVNSSTSGRKAKTKPSTYTVNKDYLCHHSNARKMQSSKKACGCHAFIKIRIKTESRYINYRDSYVKRGLKGIITINNFHNHQLDDKEELHMLKRTNETRQTFLEYFNSDLCIDYVTGMAPVSAIEGHIERLSAAGCRLEDTSINPPLRWVYHLHDKWRKDQRAAEATVNNLKTEFERIITVLQAQKSQEGVLTAVEKLTVDLQAIKSATEFKGFVCLLETATNATKSNSGCDASTQTLKVKRDIAVSRCKRLHKSTRFGGVSPIKREVLRKREKSTKNDVGTKRGKVTVKQEPVKGSEDDYDGETDSLSSD